MNTSLYSVTEAEKQENTKDFWKQSALEQFEADLELRLELRSLELQSHLEHVLTQEPSDVEVKESIARSVEQFINDGCIPPLYQTRDEQQYHFRSSGKGGLWEYLNVASIEAEVQIINNLLANGVDVEHMGSSGTRKPQRDQLLYLHGGSQGVEQKNVEHMGSSGTEKQQNNQLLYYTRGVTGVEQNCVEQNTSVEHTAILSLEEVIPPHFIAKLQKDLKQEMKKQKITYWLVTEVGRNNKIHLNLVFRGNPEAQKITQTLHSVAHDYKHRVWVSEITDFPGWIRYILKTKVSLGQIKDRYLHKRVLFAPGTGIRKVDASHDWYMVPKHKIQAILKLHQGKPTNEKITSALPALKAMLPEKKQLNRKEASGRNAYQSEYYAKNAEKLKQKRRERYIKSKQSKQSTAS